MKMKIMDNKEIENLKLLKRKWQEMMNVIYTVYFFGKAEDGEWDAFGRLLCCLSNPPENTEILEEKFKNYKSKEYKKDVEKFKTLYRIIKAGLNQIGTKYAIQIPIMFRRSGITSPGDVSGVRFLKDLSIIDDLATYRPNYPNIKDISSDDKEMRTFFEEIIFQLEEGWLEIKQPRFLTEEGIRLQCPRGHFLGRFTKETMKELNKLGEKTFPCKECGGLLRISLDKEELVFTHYLKKEVFEKMIKKVDEIQIQSRNKTS